LASAADYQVCRQIMRSASKNYSFASTFFPKETLLHVEALYALMRVGDDRVDVSHGGFSSAHQAIDDWEACYWQAFENGESPHPVMRAYLNTAIQYRIPKEIMASYFRAMREDLTIKRYLTFMDLLHYMEGSAMPVGRAMTYILGVRQPLLVEEVIPYADSLSIAMQLSNFWRDIGADWKRERIYLPQEDMDHFKYDEEDLATNRITNELINLLEFQFLRTNQYYSDAKHGIKQLASGQWAVLCGLKVYQAILGAIRGNRYDVFNYCAEPSPALKILLALSSWWQASRL
jgi:phytoene synthase